MLKRSSLLFIYLLWASFAHAQAIFNPGSGSAPCNTGTALQFNNSNAFGCVTGSSWNGTTLGMPITNYALTGVTAPAAIFDPDVLTSSGSAETDIFRIKNNEAGKGDFGFLLASTPASNGATRRDNILSFGFNPSASNFYASGDHSFDCNIENDFETVLSQHQVEYYCYFIDPAHSVNVRPFAITPSLDGGGVVISTAGEFVVRDASNAFDLVSWDTSTPSSGATMNFMDSSAVLRAQLVTNDGSDEFSIHAVSTHAIRMNAANAQVTIDAEGNHIVSIQNGHGYTQFVNDNTSGAFFLEVDSGDIGGTGTSVMNASSSDLWLNTSGTVKVTGAAHTSITHGDFLVLDLETTGSATGKKVVCVDTSTGKLYASSASNSCAN